MSTNRKRTAADVAAAIELGAIDPSAEVLTGEDARALAADAARAIDAAKAETARAAMVAATNAAATLPADAHQCGIPGCRHGAAHGPTQPDRQLKLAAPCGAVARMTARALLRAGGTITCAHGDPFAETAHRTYRRATQ